jgi:hypothetical protein
MQVNFNFQFWRVSNGKRLPTSLDGPHFRPVREGRSRGDGRGNHLLSVRQVTIATLLAINTSTLFNFTYVEAVACTLLHKTSGHALCNT